MARRCKICGEPMTHTVGEHYRDTGKGRTLYKDVRLYTCPEGCGSTYYDYRRARPADRPERVLWLLPAPGRALNVVGTLFSLGMIASVVLLVLGFLATSLPVAVKAVAIVAIVTFGVWVSEAMGNAWNEQEVRQEE